MKNVLGKYLILLSASLLLCGCWFNQIPPLSDEQEALVKAVRSPDPRIKLEPYLREVDNQVNFQLPDKGRTPLILTIILQDMTKMEQILNAGADVSIADKKGLTAAHYAAGITNPAYLKRLIKAGADVNAQDHYGRTPLMEACRLGNQKAAELLLDAGADPDIRDKNDRSIMMFAAGAPQGSLTLVRYLQEKNISPAQIDKSASFPLSCAIDAGNTETAMYLLNSNFPDDFTEYELVKFAGLLAMRHAIDKNNVVIAKELIRRKLPLNNTVSKTVQALEKAHLENWVKTIAELPFTDDKSVPLSWAAMKDNETMIQLLLDAGADPLYRDNLGNFPVDYTHSFNSKKILDRAMKKAMRGK